MKSWNAAITRRIMIAFCITLAMASLFFGGIVLSDALADEGSGDASSLANSEGDADSVIRTIMIYLDGASSEENNPVCSAMLEEYMKSKFDRSDFRIIVMTGGSLKWHLDADYLRDKDGNAGTLTEISSEYNQVWEVYGSTDSENGYLRLLDGDGVSGDGADAKKSVEELMSDPDTLKNFINFAHRIAPADKYDLILNDHGSGPQTGYGYDDHNTTNPHDTLSLLQLRQAISENDVIQEKGKFDFIDLDCCVMGNFETAVALSDYTDYFLGSADVDPLPTVDYTKVFDYLATDPNMDAWVLGRKLVDLYIDYYDEHIDKISMIGRSETYCVINTNKLKQSGIVEKMLEIARQMRAQATVGSFYDEIRTTKDSYQFALANLKDFATVMEQLGIGLYESDWKTPGFLNEYTQVALEIQNILHDENIIYSKHTKRSDETYAFFGRDDDGSITIRAKKSPTSAFSIFFFDNPAVSDVSGEVASYVEAMRELSSSYGNESTEREFFDTYMQAILDYILIYNAGVAVSTLTENGSVPDEIDYNKVLDYLKSQKSEKTKRGWEYISKAFEASDRDVKAWLSGIIEIQRKEILNHDKISLKTEVKNGTAYYRIDMKDTPRRVIDVPVLTVTVNSENKLFTQPVRTFYGTQALNGQDGESEYDYMSATDSSYLIPKFDGQWFAVKDAEGNVHLASDASENSVYASFYSMDGKSMGTGELIFDADGNANSIYIYGNTIPISLETFEGMVTVTLCNDPSLGSATPIDTFVLQGTNAKLVKDNYANLGIKDVEIKLAISDMYKVQHEVKPKLEFDPAGGKWKDGTATVKKFETTLETSFDIVDAPTRDGYTFVCWKGSEYQPGQKYLADSDHVFTAEWKKDEQPSASTSDTASDKPAGTSSSDKVDANGNKSSNGSSPKTGDMMNTATLASVVTVLAALAVLFAFKYRRKISEAEDLNIKFK